MVSSLHKKKGGHRKEIKAALDPYEGLKVKDARVQQMDRAIEDLDEFIQEEKKIANDENEQSDAREQGREKLKEYREKRNQISRERDQVLQEREQIVERLLLRDRAKERFKVLRERFFGSGSSGSLKETRLHPCNRCDCCWHNDWCYC